MLIEAHRAKTGDYPATLQVVAVVPHDVLSYYHDKTTVPSVPLAYYRDTLYPFDKWIYEFKTKTWEYQAD